MPMTPAHLRAAPPKEVIARYNSFRSKLPESDKFFVPDFSSGTVSFIGEGSIRYVFRIPSDETQTKTAVLKIGKEFFLQTEADAIKANLGTLAWLGLDAIVVPEVLYVIGDQRTGEPGRDYGLIKTDLTEGGLYLLEDVTTSGSVPVRLLTKKFHDDANTIDQVFGLDKINIFAALAIRKLLDGTPHSLCFSDMDNFRIESVVKA